jgi:hypothetical protein
MLLCFQICIDPWGAESLRRPHVIRGLLRDIIMDILLNISLHLFLYVHVGGMFIANNMLVSLCLLAHAEQKWRQIGGVKRPLNIP